MTPTPANYLGKGDHSMSFLDKSIKCSDCGTTFTFTSGEQEFFASKGFTNEPRRCPECRKAKKAARNENNDNSRSYSNVNF
jgi:N-acetylglutamate synthase-like GNAT family acetyltransferase